MRYRESGTDWRRRRAATKSPVVDRLSPVFPERDDGRRQKRVSRCQSTAVALGSRSPSVDLFVRPCRTSYWRISGGFSAGLAGILLKSGAQERVDPEMLKGSTKAHVFVRNQYMIGFQKQSTLLRTTGAVLFRTKANHKSGLMTNAKRPHLLSAVGFGPSPTGGRRKGRENGCLDDLVYTCMDITCYSRVPC